MAMAIIFAIISLAGVVLGGIDLSNSETEQCQNAGIAAMTSSAIMTLCNMMLFHGCYKQKRILFLPWLILNMISIVISYLLVLILIGSGIMALVVSQKMDGQMFYNQGEVYDGSKFALVGDLAGMSAIIAGIIALAVTIVMTYLWAVVLHLYRKMETRQYDHKLLIEEPDYVKSSEFAAE